jgi:predicted dehydrogenase
MTAVIIGMSDDGNPGRMSREHMRAYDELGIKYIVVTRHGWRDGVDFLHEQGGGYVSVCSYDDAHAEQIIHSLNRGLKVVAEKPLCLNEGDLKAIYKLATPDNLYCNLPLLHNQWLDATGAADLSGVYRWGRIDQIKGWRSECPGYSFVLGGGVHIASLLLHLKRRAITGVIDAGITQYTDGIACPTLAAVKLNYADGATGTLCVNCHYKDVHSHDVTATGAARTWHVHNKESDKTIGITKFIRDGHNDFYNTFAAHSVCFAIERALKSGKREKVEYLT